MGNNRSQATWIGGLLVLAALFFFGRRLFPSVLRTILTVAAIGMLVIAAVVVAVFVSALRKSQSGASSAKQNQTAVLSKGRSHLTRLRSMALNIKNAEVRSISNEICGSVDQILSALKQQPEDIPAVRQFFNYYLPTMGSILTKYVRVEQSGVPMGDMTENAVACLRDIKAAMDKQYENLFDDDKLDLSVEMEALTLACKRDGLLPDEGFGGSGNLTL